MQEKSQNKPEKARNKMAVSTNSINNGLIFFNITLNDNGLMLQTRNMCVKSDFLKNYLKRFRLELKTTYKVSG